MPVIRKVLGFLADSSRPASYLQHLTWFLLNIFCFPECEANAYFEEHCNILDSGCLAIQACNRELASLYKEQEKPEGWADEDLRRRISTQQKILEQVIWMISNLMIGSFEVTEKAIKQCKLFNLLGQMLYPMRDIEVHLLQLIEFLLENVRYYLEAIRHTPNDVDQEFIEFFRGIGPMLEQYLTTHKSQECRFLWFCSEYT